MSTRGSLIILEENKCTTGYVHFGGDFAANVVYGANAKLEIEDIRQKKFASQTQTLLGFSVRTHHPRVQTLTSLNVSEITLIVRSRKYNQFLNFSMT